MDGRVSVRESVLTAMLDEARRHFPQECCGLLAGEGGVVTETFATANALASEREFFIDPAELIRSLRAMRERGLAHLGIYHSHPTGENFPSHRDVEMAFYPSCAFFVISPQADPRSQIRAFSIKSGRVDELEILTIAG